MIDTAIIGGGPAALGAALYAARRGLSVTVFESKFLGGQASSTYEIDNYLGFSSRPSGPDLIAEMEKHVSKFDVKMKYSTVKSLDLSQKIKKIYTAKAEFEAKTVIIATGCNPRPLGVEGEEEFKGKGVSYCATCDGMFFKGKSVMVVGGGDTAIEDARYLSAICEKVYLVHRRDEFRASPLDIAALKANDNVEMITNATVKCLKGGDTLSSAVINTKDGEREIELSAVFVAVGTLPNSSLFENIVENENGFIITNEEMQTNIDGVFAAGDIRKKSLRQVITAVSDGAIAATNAAAYIYSE